MAALAPGRGGELKAKAAAQVPSRPKRVLDGLSREEMQALEDAAKSERDKLIIRLMADTGMRVSELLGLGFGAAAPVERGRQPSA